MKILTALLILSLLILSGCGMTTVTDWDGDNVPLEEQRRIMAKQSVQYTEDIVTLATESEIGIVATKEGQTLTFENDYEIKQDNWSIDAHNFSDIPQCVAIQWKLMDFQFISDHPTLFYVPGKSITHVGTMTQLVWEIDGIKVVPESSGFIWAMVTREPAENALKGEECTFYEKEEDLRKEKDVYVH